MANTFQCTLVTPQKQVLDEPLTYASIPAWDGQIGIAPGRAALLVKLGDGVLRLDFDGGKSRWFFLAGGFAQMKDNRLSLLTDEAVLADEIVREEVDKALEEATQLSAATLDQVEERRRRVSRARTLLHLDERGSS